MADQKVTYTVAWDKMVLYVLMAIIVIALFIYLRNCNHTGPAEIPRPLDTLRSVNKAGDSVVSLKGREIDFTVIEKRVKDSIAYVYGVRERDLREVIIAQTRTIAELSATGPLSVDYTKDTVHPNCPPVVTRMRQTFTNPYYTASVQVGDSNYLHLTDHDTLTGVWKNVTEGHFLSKKKYLQLDLSFADTARHITGLSAYRVKDPTPKKFGIGLSAGVTWNGKWAPYAGVGINWNFIRF